VFNWCKKYYCETEYANLLNCGEYYINQHALCNSYVSDVLLILLTYLRYPN